MVRLNVPYLEKDEAKALGARWNRDEKFWFCADGQEDRFRKWLPEPEGAGEERLRFAMPAITDEIPFFGTEDEPLQETAGEEAPYLTVSDVSGMIEDTFNRNSAFRMVRVRGEVQNLRPWNNSFFFDIRDDRSILSCTLWGDTVQTALDFELENGQEVGIIGDLQYYSKNGRSSLRVARIRDMGQGDYQARLNLLKDRLQAEGLFAEEHKKPLPKYPQRVAVITSRQGDALHDICRVARDRNPFVQLVLYPVTVQGNSAPASIIRGITHMDAGGYDVIIVSRGGGSREDLSPFDDEGVVRAVYHANTPIATGVGHERDVTLIDLVADKRFLTPTGAAQGVLPDVMSDIRRIRQLETAIRSGMANLVGRKRLLLQTRRERLERYNPEVLLQRNRERLERAERDLKSQMRALIDRKRHRYEVLLATLHGRSPTAKLMNGFGYVTRDGQPVLSVDGIQPGQKILVTIHDGGIAATVEEVTHGNST